MQETRWYFIGYPEVLNMKTVTLAICIAFILIMGISEAYSEENDPRTQQENDIQRTARITGDSIEVVKRYYNMCNSGVVAQMVGCVEYLWKSEDKELNNLYTQVRDRVKSKFGDGSAAEKYLIKAQRAWITFRDATCRLENEGYSHGVPPQTENLACLSDVTKKRNLELNDYLERVQ